MAGPEISRGKQTNNRFPPDVEAALIAAGWTPDRIVTESVVEWQAANAESLEGLEMTPAAADVLNEFGGLQLEQNGRMGNPNGAFWTSLYPTDEPMDTTRLHEFNDTTGLATYPLGDHTDGPSDLAIAPDERVFLVHPTGNFYVGLDFNEALVWLVRGGELLLVADDGTY